MEFSIKMNDDTKGLHNCTVYIHSHNKYALPCMTIILLCRITYDSKKNWNDGGGYTEANEIKKKMEKKYMKQWNVCERYIVRIHTKNCFQVAVSEWHKWMKNLILASITNENKYEHWTLSTIYGWSESKDCLQRT